MPKYMNFKKQLNDIVSTHFLDSSCKWFQDMKQVFLHGLQDRMKKNVLPDYPTDDAPSGS